MSRNGVGRPVWLWGVLAAVLLVVAAAFFFVDYLNGYAEDRVRAKAVLFSVEKDASQQALSEYEAINEGEVTPEVVEDVAENRRELRLALDDLERLDPQAQRLGRVRGLVGSHEAAIDEELRLIEAGRLERAEAIDEERVDPGFEALRGALEDIAVVYDGDARRAALFAAVSTYVAIFLTVGALAVLVLLGQREQARRAREEAERLGQERFRSLVRKSSDVIVVVGADRTVRYASPSVESVLGYKPEDVIGEYNFAPVHPDDLARLEEAVADALGSPGTPAYAELRLRHADGSWRRIETACTSLLDDPAVGGIVFNSRDITERKELEESLRHAASHDDLTGLPNRKLFAERLGRAVAAPNGRGGKVAVLFVDLDDFKSVNDSLGHWAGDELLELFAGRLEASVRPGDTVARFGGDEFAVLMEGVAKERAVEVAELTIARLRREPFVLGGREVYATPSIGVAVSGDAGRWGEDLMRMADLALHRAKEAGKARHACFTPDLDECLRARLRLESELRGALEGDEFRVFYQPKVSIESGEIVGMEALVRWEHPERGLLAPSEFLAVAEETGLIVSIGEWVLGEACRRAKEWQWRCPQDPPLAVSVNLSAKQFRRPDLAEYVGAVLGECGLDPRAITLEITESTAMEDAGETAAALGNLKAMGVRIEVDDFGTGYSSLS